jgi:Xaa-Pro dipeptidase
MTQTAEQFERVRQLQERMQANGWDAFVVTQHVDLFYLTGSMQAGVLWIPAVGEAVFYVRKSLSRAQAEAACRVEPIAAVRPTWGEWRSRFEGKPNIAVTFDTVTMQQLLRLQGWMNAAEWVDGSEAMRSIRSIKSASEIAAIRANAELLDDVLQEVLPQLAPGMADITILAMLEDGLRHRGHTGLLRVRASNSEIVTGTVGSGAAIAMPSSFDGPAGGEGLHPSFPKGAGRHIWSADEPLLIDIGCSLNGYVIDQTRTVVSGRMAPELERAYDVTEHILREIESKLRPGAIPEQLYEAALRMAEEAGLAAHFMGYKTDQAKFLGHAIGLEIDEWPVLAKGFDQPLQPGMVLAIEPKFTFPGQGVVGIEDTYLITSDGYERITRTPQQLFRL